MSASTSVGVVTLPLLVAFAAQLLVACSTSELMVDGTAGLAAAWEKTRQHLA